MADDSGGILSDITEAIGDVAGAAADEFKKFGQSAGSQITGGDTRSPQQSKGDIAKANKAVGSFSSDQTAVDEVKGFGKSFLGQITGHMDTVGADIAKMAKADKKFSKIESEKIKARIGQIYQEHAARRLREKQQQEIVTKQREEQTKALDEQQKKENVEATNPAIVKTRVENKNYGAE